MVTFIKSVGNALNGLRACFIREAHFRVHSAFTIMAIAAGIIIKLSGMEWLIIIILIAAVIAAELVNTSIELLCNIVYKEQHPGIKLIKDMAAAAVLVVSIAAIIGGLAIFIPKILLMLN